MRAHNQRPDEDIPRRQPATSQGEKTQEKHADILTLNFQPLKL